jgi:hypothetical protein
MRYLEAEANSELRRDLRRLGAILILGNLDLENAVEVATSVVASGVDSPSAVALASLSLGAKRLSSFEIEPLVRTMLAELGCAIPNENAAGWTMAGFIADAMTVGALDPPTGAHRLWGLWHICGTPGDELTDMLQLHDAWEASVGERKTEIEAEMLAYAPTVAAAAKRHSTD